MFFFLCKNIFSDKIFLLFYLFGSSYIFSFVNSTIISKKMYRVFYFSIFMGNYLLIDSKFVKMAKNI